MEGKQGDNLSSDVVRQITDLTLCSMVVVCSRG
jgi:hypothetical protein